jgi:hypothetical protein
MGKIFKAYLADGGGSVIYRCVSCNAHLAEADALVSKAFQASCRRVFMVRLENESVEHDAVQKLLLLFPRAPPRAPLCFITLSFTSP